MAELKMDFAKMAEGFTKTAKEKGMFVGWWIPVSERLPEEPGEYLITWTGILGEHSTKRTRPLMSIAEYEIYEPENYEDWITTGDEFEYYRDIKVSAWMPLPESYKPQESEG